MKNEPVLEATVPESDMSHFRKSLQGYCTARHGDFETVNLFVTLKRTVNELNGILEAYYPGPLRVTIRSSQCDVVQRVSYSFF